LTRNTGRLNRWLLYLLLAACVILAARIGERYPLRIDVSSERVNSVTTAAAGALDALPDGLVIEVYLPALAVQRAQAEQLLVPYQAYKAGLVVRFVDPVAQPQRARAAGITRHGEMHLRIGQRREIVRQPSGAALDAALIRLARQGDRWIVVLEGYGERPLDDGPGGLDRFADAVEMLGYRVVTLDPRQLDNLPGNTAVVLVAGPAENYPEHVITLLSRYLDKPGALWWLAGSHNAALTRLGLPVTLLPGTIVDAAAARFGLDSPDHAIVTDYPAGFDPTLRDASLLRGMQALGWRATPGWQLLGRLQSSPRSWNETGGLTGRIGRDPAAGEHAGPLDAVLAMERTSDTDAPGARIVVAGGATWLGNDEIGRGANRQLAMALVNWLSRNDGLAPGKPAADLDVRWSPRFGAALAIALTLLLPGLYLAFGLWLRARRRRA
jgi:hypothetical protein